MEDKALIEDFIKVIDELSIIAWEIYDQIAQTKIYRAPDGKRYIEFNDDIQKTIFIYPQLVAALEYCSRVLKLLNTAVEEENACLLDLEKFLLPNKLVH